MTDVRSIIIDFLQANGYDGLVNLDAECGCAMDDLAVCDSPFVECVPAYRWESCGGCAALEEHDGDSGFCEWEGCGCFRTERPPGSEVALHHIDQLRKEIA